MRSVARLAMRGPNHAAALAAGFLFASPLVAFLLVPSGALVALATLRHGAGSGLRVMLTAAALAGGVRLVVAGDAAALLLLGAMIWLPAWSMALALGYRRQQADPLLLAALLVGGYAVAMRLLVGDVAAYWSARLAPVFEVLARDAGASFTPAQIAAFAGQLHLWSLVGIHVLLAAVILLARWWQAVLFNPGGFGTEFRELALPRAALLATGIAALLLLADRADAVALPGAGDACVILMVLFAFQGLAVIHFRARRRALAGGWLAGMYVLLVLMPQLVGPLLASTGLVDSVADWRHLRRPRVPAAPPSDQDAPR